MNGLSYFEQILELRFQQLILSAPFDIKYLLLKHILLTYPYTSLEQVKNIQYFKFWLIKKQRAGLLELLYQRLEASVGLDNGRMICKMFKAKKTGRKSEKYEHVLDKIIIPNKRCKYGFFWSF